MQQYDAEQIWSDDGRQLTIKTNMGPDAARKLADVASSGRALIWWITHADQNGFVDYVFTV